MSENFQAIFGCIMLFFAGIGLVTVGRKLLDAISGRRPAPLVRGDGRGTRQHDDRDH